MNKKIRFILYGLLIWFIPALTAMLLWDTSTNLPKMSMLWFNAIMATVWSFNFAIVIYFYFKKIDSNYIKEGLILGIFWYILCLSLDFVMFLSFKIDFSTWYPGILTYSNNLVIPISIGFILSKGGKN